MSFLEKHDVLTTGIFYYLDAKFLHIQIDAKFAKLELTKQQKHAVSSYLLFADPKHLCLRHAASCLACYLMDKVGRRSLMIYSFTGMVSLGFSNIIRCMSAL